MKRPYLPHLVVIVVLLVMAACSSHPAPSDSASQNPDSNYVEYPVASVDSLREQLNRVGPAILRVKQTAKWDSVLLQVVPVPNAAARLMTDSQPPIDDSRRCPPICV